MGINPGRLREVVTLQNPKTVTSDQYGRPTDDTYETVEDLRADVDEDPSGEEYRRAGQDKPRADVVLTMRARDDVDTRSRFLWRGKTLRVETPARIDRMRRWMIVECVFGGPDG